MARHLIRFFSLRGAVGWLALMAISLPATPLEATSGRQQEESLQEGSVGSDEVPMQDPRPEGGEPEGAGEGEGESEPRFIDNGDGTVSDRATGLTWLRDASCSELAGTAEDGSADWQTAFDAVAALHSGDCGLTDGSEKGDWRLPEIAEFCSAWEGVEVRCPEAAGADSLVAAQPEGPKVPMTDGADGEPLFLGVESARYWAATRPYYNVAWFADLSDGRIFYTYTAETGLFVWPVRARP